MATSIMPRTGARPPPPSTPRRGGTEQINQIIADLNREFPSLKLRPRREPESPSQRQNNAEELCYDRITFYYFQRQAELQAALSNFRYEVRKGTAPHPLITLLNCLPRETSSGGRIPWAGVTGEAPIPMGTLLYCKEPRPRTPEPNEDNDRDIAPLSPSPSVRRAERGLRTPLRKRPSTDHPETPSARATKVSRASESSHSTMYHTPGPASPLEPRSPLDAANGDISFGSTVRDNAKIGDISFRTEITVPDADSTQESECYASSFSLSTQLRNVLDGKRSSSEKTSRGSNNSSKSRAVHQWRETVDVSAKPVRDTVSTDSYGTSLSSETREAFAQVAYNPVTSSRPQPDASPSQGLAQLSLQSPSQRLDNTSGSVQNPSPLVSYQISRLASQGLFVSTACDEFADFRILWECYRLHTVSKIDLPDLLKVAVPLEHLSHVVPTLRRKFPELAGSNFKQTADDVWASHCLPPGLQLKARLVFHESATQPQLFRLELLPLEIGLSCRFQRKYGNDRLLYLEVPDLERCPQCFAGKQQLPERFADWLHPNQAKELLGREWRALHLEQSKRKRKDEFGGFRVVLIATAGRGLETLTMSSILNFFMDTTAEGNLNQSFRKAYSRLDLGFSKTEPTYTFLPSQIIRVPDRTADLQARAPTEFNEPSTDWSHVPDKSNHTMDDGVNLISVGAAKLVRESLGSQWLPTAFQARLAGAKGMWSLSGPPDSTDEEDLETWIRINDSQWKFDVSVADNDERFDRDRWTFEVLKVSSSSSKPSFGSLHVDMIPLLCDRGVKIEDIQEVVAESLTQTGDELMEAFKEAEHMKRWLHQHFPRDDGSREEKMQGGLPQGFLAKANFLLDHGFAPTECKYLAQTIQNVAQDVFDRAIRNPAYDLAQSVQLQAVADPLGVLAPNEIHVAFSESRSDAASGKRYSWLHGQEVLITRHPMQMPSDIQKVRTRYCQELSHYLDVVVVPVTGPWSLVALLQGGDLDGDTYTVVWHPNLVKDFVNCPPSRDLFDHGQSEDEIKQQALTHFGIRKEKRTLGQVLVGPDPASNFLFEGMKARLQRVPLGQVTVLAKKLAYALGPEAYKSRAMRLLAQLYTLLIDADKNGYYYSDKALNEYKKRETEFSKAADSPAFMQVMKHGVDAHFRVPPREFSWMHPCDVVIIDHIRPQILSIRQRIKEVVENIEYVDSDLSDLSQRYENDPDPDVRSAMRALKAHIVKFKKTKWAGMWGRNFDKPVHDRNGSSKPSAEQIERCSREFQNDIQPLLHDHPVLAGWHHKRLPGEPTHFELIRASATYVECAKDEKTTFAWTVAGGVLAYIKAQNTPGSRMMVPAIRTMLRPKKQRSKMLELDDRSHRNTGQGVSDDTGEDFHSADEGEVEGDLYA